MVSRARGTDAAGRPAAGLRWALWGAGLSGVALALVVLFLFDPRTSSIYPPCPFRTMTGLLCPGCGSTRAIHALLHGRVIEAFTLNALLFVISPLLAVMQWSPRLGLDDRRLRQVRTFGSWAVLLLVLGFGIARNL